jgi:hypothetical protein
MTDRTIADADLPFIEARTIEAQVRLISTGHELQVLITSTEEKWVETTHHVVLAGIEIRNAVLATSNDNAPIAIVFNY